jgi:hypothetical protein
MDSNSNIESSLPVRISTRTLDAFANLWPAGFSIKDTLLAPRAVVLGKLNVSPVIPSLVTEAPLPEIAFGELFGWTWYCAAEASVPSYEPVREFLT